MKTAFALVFALLAFTAHAGFFDGDDEEKRKLTFIEGISYDFSVYTDTDKPFIGTFVISEADAKLVSEQSVILKVRMTGMSYKRFVHIKANVTNATGTYLASSYVVEGDSFSSLPTGGSLNTAYMELPAGSCTNGCTFQFFMNAVCEYTCFRSVSVRASAHLGDGRKIYRNEEDSEHYTPLTLHEWSSEVILTSDSVDKPSCYYINIEADDTVEHLVTTERSTDGSPLLVLAGSGDNKEPSQKKGSDWVMVNTQNYRDFKKGDNYICLSTTDVASGERTIARIKIGAASTLSVSIFLLFAVVALMF